MNKLFGLLFISILIAWQMPQENESWKDKIAPSLLSQLEVGGSIDFLIILEQQADVSESKNIHGKFKKGRFVYAELKSIAQETQSPIIEVLKQWESECQSFFVVNAIRAKGNIELAHELALMTQIKRIEANPWVQLEIITEDRTEDNSRNVIEWGIEKIKADQVWNMGYTGEGVIVAGADTGVEWEHPAISQKYKGWTTEGVDHNYNWHDAIHEISPLHNDSIVDPSNNPCGLNTTAPCDDHNHGTHTVGTMTGEDGENQIGVAPGSRWIACRNMERGWGSPASYIECFEWFLAPTDSLGQNANPDKSPHVINNSWGCPAIEGCNADNWSSMDMVIDNLRAAGIVPVVSAGNSGSSCGSVSNPAAIFEGSFTIGASQANDTIAGFSSRGTVTVDGSGRLKPNVVAPGVGVRSCIRNGNYASWNGTSMAGPHVAGLVALMISANPDLAGEVDLIEDIIEATAVPLFLPDSCGGISGMEHPNPIYGFGRIDALAAVEEALLYTPVNEPLIQENNFTVYPNPFSDYLELRGEEIKGDVYFYLYSANGQKIKEAYFKQGTATFKTISMKGLSSGVYFYEFVGEGVRQRGKVIKVD